MKTRNGRIYETSDRKSTFSFGADISMKNGYVATATWTTSSARGQGTMTLYANTKTEAGGTFGLTNIPLRNGGVLGVNVDLKYNNKNSEPFAMYVGVTRNY